MLTLGEIKWQLFFVLTCIDQHFQDLQGCSTLHLAGFPALKDKLLAVDALTFVQLFLDKFSRKVIFHDGYGRDAWEELMTALTIDQVREDQATDLIKPIYPGHRNSSN